MNRRELIKCGVGIGSSLGLSTSAGPARPQAQKSPRVIDAHSHAGRGMNYGKRDADPWTTYNDPEWLLRRAEQAGIDQSVIFPINNETYEKANEEIAGYVRRYPGKFIGFAKHDPIAEAGRIRKMLTREVEELGLRGLKLHGVPSKEMVETAADLGIPILFHPGKVEDCLEVVRANPKVSFILAHLGSFASRSWREHIRAIDAARELPNLHLDTSGVVFFGYLERAVRELPAEKIVFGSDGPLVDSRVELHKIRLLNLPEDHEALILGGNISRLLAN